ncbi:hypothetical protein B0A55_00571 [Friedmanniomyces simplex]|uniref:Phosphate transporter n=1 Tax=Friedmanniomyces simplex TaxID=329884 RepID=A0A4U0Y027_9PEZI|nr:hypothetical protein B0A55_00571 [Friedmanniomyces simplex]
MVFDTIKNGIIPTSAFKDNAGVLAAASTWVMWCTKHSAHVSSTYSLISAVAGVGVATAGASQVQWGWNGGKGLGAVFAGLGMAPAISAGFAGTIFILIKLVVHLRHNPVPWAVFTSPFFFLIAGTICTLSIVYKGSPNLGLNKKPSWYVAAVTMGTGGGVALLAALFFFVPFIYQRVVRKDQGVKCYMFPLGPLLFRRAVVAEADHAKLPNYAVVQDDDASKTRVSTDAGSDSDGDVKTPHIRGDNEKALTMTETAEIQKTYKELRAEGQEKVLFKMRAERGPFGWAMRTLHDNPTGPGQVYERDNLLIIAKRLPAMVVAGLLYGVHYEIHAAQSGIAGTLEGERMKRVYAQAKKYPDEVVHTYSFVQVLTACTASFAHGANDTGNSVGPWAVIYSA